MTAKAKGNPATFRFDGRDVPVPTDATIGETLEVERVIGIRAQDASQTEALAASLFIALRRDRPDEDGATIAELVNGINLIELSQSIGKRNGASADAGPPPRSGGPAATRRRARSVPK